MSSTPFADAAHAAEFLFDVFGDAAVDVAVVCGSGLGGFAERLEGSSSIAQSAVPGFAAPTVPGHSGRLHVGTVDGVRVAVFAGRCHLYEGHDASTVVHGVRTAAALGARAVVLTNAAGSTTRRFAPGDVVAISDHVNVSGANPLVGPLDSDRSRFVDLGRLYSRELTEVALASEVCAGEGVYAQFCGPSYETPAEVRAISRAGADLVGMSTALEAIAAHHVGLEVAALSLVTNMAAGLASSLSHDEVADVAGVAGPRLEGLLVDLVVAAAERPAPPRPDPEF